MFHFIFGSLKNWVSEFFVTQVKTQYGSKLAILLLPWLFQVVRYISLLFFIRENLPKESHRSRASRFPILDSDRTFQNFRSPFVDPRFFLTTQSWPIKGNWRLWNCDMLCQDRGMKVLFHISMKLISLSTHHRSMPSFLEPPSRHADILCFRFLTIHIPFWLSASCAWDLYRKMNWNRFSSFVARVPFQTFIFSAYDSYVQESSYQMGIAASFCKSPLKTEVVGVWSTLCLHEA